MNNAEDRFLKKKQFLIEFQTVSSVCNCYTLEAVTKIIKHVSNDVDFL